MRALVAAIIIAITPQAQAAKTIQCPPQISKGMSYHIARGRLIDAGYRPLPFTGGDRHAGNSAWLHLGYIEHADGDNGAHGFYAWRKLGQAPLFVVTQGEGEDPDIPTVELCKRYR